MNNSKLRNWLLAAGIGVAIAVLPSFLDGSHTWHLTRAAGLVSATLLIMLGISGIGLVSGYTTRVLEPVLAWAVHRAIAIALCYTVLLHLSTLFWDTYRPFKILEILVPFNSTYRVAKFGSISLGSLWVALGVIAVYGLAVLVVMSLIRLHKPGWKLTHYLSYAVVAAVFFHSLYLGTDLAGGWLRWAFIAVGVVIAWAAVYRTFFRVE